MNECIGGSRDGDGQYAAAEGGELAGGEVPDPALGDGLVRCVIQIDRIVDLDGTSMAEVDTEREGARRLRPDCVARDTDMFMPLVEQSGMLRDNCARPKMPGPPRHRHKSGRYNE